MSNTVQKMLSGTLYVILAVVLVGAVILILPVYWKYVTMQDENTRMEQEYRALREEQQRMLKEVHDLESESLAVEKIAREKYNLCRKNEQAVKTCHGSAFVMWSACRPVVGGLALIDVSAVGSHILPSRRREYCAFKTFSQWECTERLNGGDGVISRLCRCRMR